MNPYGLLPDIRAILAANPIQRTVDSAGQDYVIPYRIITSAEEWPDEWHEVHCFMRGWGYVNQRTRQSLYAGEVDHYLDVNLFAVVTDPAGQRADLERLYRDLQRTQHEIHRWSPPRPRPEFTRICLPRLRG